MKYRGMVSLPDAVKPKARGTALMFTNNFEETALLLVLLPEFSN